jgi:hypothetical protein
LEEALKEGADGIIDTDDEEWLLVRVVVVVVDAEKIDRDAEDAERQAASRSLSVMVAILASTKRGLGLAMVDCSWLCSLFMIVTFDGSAQTAGMVARVVLQR